jgi:hypothetical protein
MYSTPESIRCNTGDQHPIYDRVEQFFEDTKTMLHPEPVPDHWFEILMHQSICKFGDLPSDDKLHALKYRGSKVIAIVTETRDEMNWIQFDFFRNLEGVIKGNVNDYT